MKILNKFRLNTEATHSHKTKRRFYIEVTMAFLVLILVISLTSLISPYKPLNNYIFYENDKTPAQYYRADVKHINDSTVSVELLDGPSKGEVVSVKSYGMEKSLDIQAGETVLVSDNGPDTSMQMIDRYRIPGLVGLLAVFIILVLLIGRRRGITSLVGLTSSVIVVGWFIIPLIIAGHDALLISIIGAGIIAVFSIVVAHGLKLRTFVSLLCVLLVLVLVAIGSSLTVTLLGLSGFSEEASGFLSITQPGIDLSGVLAGGIIIASLGVLDDIITAQVATVDELIKSNPKLKLDQLIRHATSVGNEHIAALVNTIALVYVGSALPMLILLISTNQSSNLVLINGEYLAVEITRTLVASIALVVSVPLSTVLGSYMLLSRNNVDINKINNPS